MKSRCTDSNHKGYKYYGEKGITICDEWREFKNFKEWALNNGYADDLTLDRIDNSKGYSPDNCRWVSMKHQENHRSNNHIITFLGKSMTVREWEDYFEYPEGAIQNRLDKGWSEDRAIITPYKRRTPAEYTYQGETHTLREWAEITGIKANTLRERIRAGKPMNEVFGERRK